MEHQVNNLTTVIREDLCQALAAEHASLDQLFQQLLEAFQADARVEAAKLWDRFDSRLREHMSVEERFILPAFARVDPPLAAALLREHESLREQLLQLGIGVDLHIARSTQVETFVRQLEAHARREDSLMYRFVARGLSELEQRPLSHALFGGHAS